MADRLTGYALFVFQVEEEGGIWRPLFNDIVEALDGCIDTPPEESHLDLWLDSPGGSADIAFKIILELRSRVKSLHCMVPDYAKSAATLIALGSDRIYMTPSAELGPLDVQIVHPDRENERLSGLDLVNSLAQITTAANDMVIAQGAKLLKYTALTRTEVLHEELAFMAQLLQPVMAKIDPSILHRASNQLRVAEAYAERLLAQRSVESKYVLNPAQAQRLARGLVHNYPAHGFVISRQEASDMGLPIYQLEGHPHLEIAKQIYADAVSKPNLVDVVGIYKHSELEKTENKTEEHEQNGSGPTPTGNGKETRVRPSGAGPSKPRR